MTSDQRDHGDEDPLDPFSNNPEAAAVVPEVGGDLPQVPKSTKRFPVIELFGPVIQGEGSQAGNQTMFIRFGGCDYRCKKCDSLHAVMPAAIQKHRKMLTPDEIMDTLRIARASTGVRWVTFSGGNPCMHQLDELVTALIQEGFHINVETQGTLAPDWLRDVTLVTTSPKSMGMGETFEADKYAKFLRKVLMANRPLCVKVVVFSSQDLEFALHVEQITRDMIASIYSDPTFYPVSFYLSQGNPTPPVLDDENNLVESPIIELAEEVRPAGVLARKLLKEYQEMSEEVLQDPRLKAWRFLPQLHVLVYGNESER